jgi:hypothetical protein
MRNESQKIRSKKNTDEYGIGVLYMCIQDKELL